MVTNRVYSFTKHRLNYVGAVRKKKHRDERKRTISFLCGLSDAYELEYIALNYGFPICVDYKTRFGYGECAFCSKAGIEVCVSCQAD